MAEQRVHRRRLRPDSTAYRAADSPDLAALPRSGEQFHQRLHVRDWPGIGAAERTGPTRRFEPSLAAWNTTHSDAPD
ncbi:hypothetical protein GCM10027569_90430 [Flindersiella endophytica]